VQHLKIWGDRYPFIGETKGSAVMVEPRRFFVIITSNFPMEQCFTRQEDLEALKRRFHVIHMTEDKRVLVETMRLDQEILGQ
jgi:MoxR-like ATPase